MRRFHEGAASRRTGEAQRNAGHHRLGHLGDTHFRSGVGLLGFHALPGRVSIARTARRLRAFRQCLSELERQQSTQLAELQERLDFAERLLAKSRDRSALGAGEKRE